MKLINSKDLGINPKTGTIHVDNYVHFAKEDGNDFKVMCGVYHHTALYETYSTHGDYEKIRLCKKCLKISYNKGYDLVTTVIKMKLTNGGK